MNTLASTPATLPPSRRVLHILVVLVAVGALGVTALPLSATLLNMPNGPGGLDVNFSTAVVRIDGDHYYYGSTQTEKILFNVKLDTNNDGEPDTWKYPQSKFAIDMAGLHGSDPQATTAMGAVLSMWEEGVQVCYNNPATPWICYRAAMYFVFQGGPNIDAGQVCVAFSNDLETWSRPISAQHGYGGQWHDCDDNLGEVTAEAVSAFHPYGDANVSIIHQEGDFQTVIGAVGTLNTTAWLSQTSSHQPHVIHYNAQLSSTGLRTATYGPGTDPYRFFVNLDAGILPDGKTVFMTRTYPYPFDLQGSVPAINNHPCPTGIAELPNRVQLLWMNTGSNLQNIGTGTWTLDIDFGQSKGWWVQTFGGTVQAPLASFMTAGNLDMESINFVRDGFGRLWDRDPSNGLRYRVVHSGQPNKTLECANSGGTEPVDFNTMRFDDFQSTGSSPGTNG